MWNHLCLYQLPFASKKAGKRNQWSVTREKEKMGSNPKVQSQSPRIMRHIFKHDECCITLLHYLLPVGKGKTHSCFHEFRQIICPLFTSSKKQHFGKIFKIQVFEVHIDNDGISCNCYAKIYKSSWKKGNNSFQLHHFFDKHILFSCRWTEH